MSAGQPGVDAVDRALAILASFEPGRERQTLAALARRTGLYKSTILRLAASLERAGYLHRGDDGAFGLGAEPVRLAAVYRRASGLERQARPILRALRDDTGESASLFVRRGTRRQCLFREETPRAIRDHIMEGDALPLDVGAAGHVLTAFARGPWDRDPHVKLMAKLPMASFGERDPDTAAIAAPVFDSSELVGALAISGPRSRVTPETLASLGERVVVRARELSRLLGGGGAWPEPA